uniref:Uncharacterized protein n=1 Tax=Biomphalaria glabrata TaxID=6526 RepID=A0A2C9LL41_BIOGL
MAERKEKTSQEYINHCLTDAVYGNICDSEQSYPVCVNDYVCRPPNTTGPNLCLCSTSQFWSSGCVDIKEIAVSNITATVEINKITLNWNVIKQYSSNVTYTIKTDFGKSESVTSNGGIVIELQSGSKYNFTVVSTPPKDTFVNYSDYSVPSEPFWTYAVYGNVCESEQTYPVCISGYVCRPPNTTAPNLCLCETSQIWSSGCVDSEYSTWLKNFIHSVCVSLYYFLYLAGFFPFLSDVILYCIVAFIQNSKSQHSFLFKLKL